MKSVRILYVEDSAADVELVRESLEAGPDDVTICVARNGTEAVAMLFRLGVHEAAPRPDLVLLDLNLPQLPGREVLAAIKADASLRTLPVVVLTSSAADADVRESLSLGACAFLTKPIDLHGFRNVVVKLRGFWVETATYPD